MPEQTRSRPAPAAVAPAPEPAVAAASPSRGNGFAAEQLSSAGAESTHAPPAAGTTSGTTTGGRGPLKRSNPAPVVPGEQRRTVLGVMIIGSDVSPTALDACEDFVRLTLSARRDVQDRLRAEQVALVIIGRNQKMTDLPQFASLRGTNTIDGRLWDNVRGSGGIRASGGVWAVGVAEETLVEVGNDAYGAGHSVGLHELAHTIHSKGLTRAERRRVTALYQARVDAGGPWTETYGASNENEYFAQSTNCFFRENRGVGRNDPEWLRTNDAEMYAFLVSIYGQPPALAAAPGTPGTATPGGTSPGGVTPGGGSPTPVQPAAPA